MVWSVLEYVEDPESQVVFLSPNAFQSILHIFPLLDDVSIGDGCRALAETESGRTLKQHLRESVTCFRGKPGHGNEHSRNSFRAFR